MDVVKFVIQKGRYCNSHFCNNCPIYYECDHDENLSAAKKIVEEIEKWAEAHPLKTRAAKFFEQYPTAPKNLDGYPEIDPCVMCDEYRQKRDIGCEGVDCLKCRDEYWGEEIK